MTDSVGTTSNVSPPLMLDGWSNPILFIPPGGLRTTIEGQKKIVTSGGVVNDSPGPGETYPVPGSRAFFASAGPDGDFSQGDDNVY